MKIVHFEYGHGVLPAELPDSADVFIPGETVPDPPCLSDPWSATEEAIRNPVDLPPLKQQAGPDSRVVIIFPDKVKGGFQSSSHRRVTISIVLKELKHCGVRPENILLVCSIGLHRKNTPSELRRILGDEIFFQFYPRKQLINHDSEDWDNLVDLGYTANKDKVVVNRMVYEADIAILIGHVMGNPYGGYSGLYKHCATGITNWECIASHHVPEVMHRPDFTPVRSDSLMSQKFNQIGQHIEEKMGKKFFCVDAVLDTQARQIAVAAGYAKSLQPILFPIADLRTNVYWAEKEYDIMVFGLPQEFHYGNGHGTNPCLFMQAIAANIIRHRRVMKKGFVIICSSICNGYFHDEEFPSFRRIYELCQRNYVNTLAEACLYSGEIARDQDLINKYRFNYGFHPFHGFSMISCGHLVEKHTLAAYMVGAQEPGYARSMGLKTRASFAEALEDAKRYVGDDPQILALPLAFKKAAVHLMPKKDQPKG